MSERDDVLEWAEMYKNLDDPDDPYPSDVVGRLARALLAEAELVDKLQAEIEDWHASRDRVRMVLDSTPTIPIPPRRRSKR